MADFRVETIWLDLPATAGAFSRALHDGGVPVTVAQSEAFARSLALIRPVSRRRLYFTARAVFVSDPGQIRAFNRVFSAVFGNEIPSEADVESPAGDVVPGGPDERPAAHGEPGGGMSSPGAGEAAGEPLDVPVPMLASADEVLRDKRFDTLDPHELAQLYGLMAQLRLATPVRRTRRRERSGHGSQIDLRRTLRGSLRSAGEPMHLRRRQRRIVPRRLVLLCDISGSMEPYARAYLQFLVSAAHGGARHREAFVFATRLTRLTRALATRSPQRALQNAAAAAPDWSSGTRIGNALKTFNDRHGRRGMARGAVVVILSDGWERDDPELLEREMARLRRLAHRIVWVNPRVAASGFVPRAGGMAAALPYCDALVSGHTVRALEEVVRAIAGTGDSELPVVEPMPEDDPWPSATPVPGSSVAMPSGYGPSRGRTTPGWSIG